MGGGGSSDDIIPGTATAYQTVAPVMGDNPSLQALYQQALNMEGLGNNAYNSLWSKFYDPFLTGDYDASKSSYFKSMYDTMRNTYEGSYNTAKDELIANTPRGGATTDALAKLGFERAKTIGQATSKLNTDIWDKLWTGVNAMAKDTSTMAMGGLGSAATTQQSALNTQNTNETGINEANLSALMQASLANLQANTAAQTANASSSSSSGKSGLGSGIGSLLGTVASVAAAPFTGGTSLIGTGLSALSGLTSGKSSGGTTSGLGGYSTLMNQAMSSTSSGGWT